MELIEHMRIKNHYPGRATSFDKYSVPLSKNDFTQKCWKFSKNYDKELIIQQVMRGKKNGIFEDEILIISKAKV